MADVKISDGLVIIELRGLDKILAFKGRLEIPLSHVRSARVDPQAASGPWHGLRLPGTNVPGVVTAGSFRDEGEWTFFDVHDPSKAVVIELGGHERYKRLVIEVEDPAHVVRSLNQAVAGY